MDFNHLLVRGQVIKFDNSISLHKMCRFTSSYTCAQSHPGMCSPLKHSAVTIDSVNRQRRPWSDCTNVQSHLGLCCPAMPKDMFSHGVAHFKISTMHVSWTSDLWFNFYLHGHNARTELSGTRKLFRILIWEINLFLTHCRLNELPHTISWKILISIWGISGYMI